PSTRRSSRTARSLAQLGQHLRSNLIRGALDRYGNRVFVRARRFQRVELALQQARRHEMAAALCHPPRDEVLAAAEENQPHLRAVADEDAAVAALQRRAGDDP